MQLKTKLDHLNSKSKLYSNAIQKNHICKSIKLDVPNSMKLLKYKSSFSLTRHQGKLQEINSTPKKSKTRLGPLKN